MNCYRLPAYIVLEIPEPVRGAIQSLRDFLATPAARLPVEITVAGSSGIGPIPPATAKHEIESLLKPVLTGLKPFRAQFQQIRCFPNTNIFYLAPQDRQPFDRIHETLRSSGIKFGPSPWPYNPHCTLRGGPMNDRASAEQILNLSVPHEEFVIDSVSIYEFDPRTAASHLAWQTKL
jgi:2'-5' RNA ligase